MLKSTTSLTDPQPYMNIDYPLSFNAEEWLRNRACIELRKSEIQRLNPLNKGYSVDLQERTNVLVQDLLKQFQEKFKKKQTELQSKKECFKPEDYLETLRMVALDLIERQVKFYQVNSPNHAEEELTNWNNFRYQFSQLSPEKSAPVKSLNKYLNQLREKIATTCPRSASRELTKLVQSEWDTLKDLISYDSDLMFTPIAALTGLLSITEETDKKHITISAKHLLTVYNHLIDQCLEDIPWACNVVMTKLRPFLNLPQDEMMNFSRSYLELISKFQENYLPSIATLHIKRYSDFSKKRKEFLEKLQRTLVHHCDASQLFLEQSIIKQDSISFTVLRNLSNFTPLFTSHSEILTYLHNLKNTLKDIHAKKSQGKTLDKAQEELYPCYNPKNLENLDNAILFYQELNECNKLLEVIFLNKLFKLCEIGLLLNNWYFKLSRKRRRDIDSSPSAELPQPQNSVQSKINEKSIDEILKSFDTPERRKKPSKSKQKSKSTENNSTSPALGQLTPSKIEPVVSPKNSSTISKLSEISLYDQMINVLSDIIQNTNQAALKNSARHAYLYLQDLIVAHETLSKTTDPNGRLFYLITIIHSAYFHLEQMLDHEVYRNSDQVELKSGHNLIQLMKESKLAGIIKNKELIDQLYLGHYWVCQPLEQQTKRESWNIPPTLKTILEIYEAKETTSLTSNKINAYIQTLPAFTNQLPSIKNAMAISKSAKTLSTNISPEFFQHKVQWDLQKIEDIRRKFEELSDAIPHAFQPKFHQISLHLRLIEGILHELSQPNVDSNLFSLLVRSLIFWENMVLEEVLKSLYSVKSGTRESSHSLVSLWKKITWKQQPKEKDLRFLKEGMQDIHYSSRYPFSLNSSSKLHQRILQAELLRERPDLGLPEPFRLNSENHKTPLNYIPVLKEEFTPEHILLDLQTTTKKIMKLIEKRTLPELQEAFIG